MADEDSESGEGLRLGWRADGRVSSQVCGIGSKVVVLCPETEVLTPLRHLPQVQPQTFGASLEPSGGQVGRDPSAWISGSR